LKFGADGVQRDLAQRYLRLARQGLVNQAEIFPDSAGQGGLVISPFLMGSSRRIQAADFSFIAGVMPPMPKLGRTLL